MSQRIIEAILNSQYSQLLLFMRHNYNFKIKTKHDSHNILMIALDIKDPARRMKMLKFLIKQNLVDILEQDINGQDIFFHSVIRELETEFDFLLTNYISEIDLTKMDNFGKTVLHYAVINNNLKILKSLLINFSKYRISVDIPDKISKITPYLLACRLNYLDASDMILKIGHASKNQADRTSFFDAEQWKKEGQIELFKNYLKINEKEINKAKLRGNLRVFKQLKDLSDSLDNEVEKNPEILPAIAKVINDHRVKDYNLMQKSSQNVVPLMKVQKSTPEIVQEINYFQKKEQTYDRFKHSASSNHSFVPSSTSTSAFSNYSKSPYIPKNSTLKKPEINLLLEMTANSTLVDHYIGSKSESELKTELSERSTNSSIKPKSNSTVHSDNNAYYSARSFDLSDMFNVQSAQNTESYRKTVKYVPEQPILTIRRNSKLKPRPKCISTFKLITIDEESKLTSSYKKFTNSKIKITT